MDFDDEMSGLQIEDLGEFFPTEMDDSWKGFTLGYVEEEKARAPSVGAAPRTRASTLGLAAAVPIGSSAPIAIPNHKLSEPQPQPQLFTSPPMSSFSEMLKLGSAFSLGSPRQDLSFSPSLFASAANLLRADTDSKMNDDPMDLSTFSLDALRKIPAPPPTQRAVMLKPSAPAPVTPASTSAAMKASPAKTPVPVCQNILGAEGKLPANSRDTESSAKRPFEDVESCSADSCSTIAQPEDDRGYRKKSREKMRRQEVNVKFDELIDLLGLSNRVRKSAILQEAVAAIKALKRDRDEMRRERDLLQHEVSKLATCLQYSHLGSVAAANAISMNQLFR
ncbi:hypothetical protein PybrP1_005059 [[Pythium] brassicae (nom. inval.)]|nr:hypothetical protein PybrP1_005059 [[Pythium] brassicae (nom. inval.)]